MDTEPVIGADERSSLGVTELGSTTHPLPPKIIRRAHEFEGDEDVGIKFCGSVVVYEVGDCIFVARLSEEVPMEGPLCLDGVTGTKVSTEHVFPLFDPTKFTAAADPLPEELYCKRPSFIDYDEKDYIDEVPGASLDAELILREAEIYEKLKRFPHKNIVQYYGCKVRHGRLVGLYLEQLNETLSQRLSRMGSSIDIQNCMDGISSSIEHLHKIGLCHNDINPTNVMFRKNDTPVLIDFDSCQPIGEKLSLKVGTEDWHDPSQQASVVDNDKNGLKKMESYMKDWMSRALSRGH